MVCCKKKELSHGDGSFLEDKLGAVDGADARAQGDEAAKRKGDEQRGLLAIEGLLLLAGAVDGLTAQNHQHTKEK